MGAGSQSRFNRLLPDLGFRDRSRHKGVHCVYAWSRICGLFCPALRRRGVKVDAFKLVGVGHFQVHHSGIWNAIMLPV